MSGLVDALADVVGERNVLTDPDVRSSYEVDWTGRFRGEARCVVRPGATDEVAGVLRACGDAGAAVVPQGGNTGLVGGGVPAPAYGREHVVLSLARLDEVGEVDAAAAQVTAGAGATLAAVQRAAERAGLAFGVDHGARDSATIGGMVSTNAGGVHVVRHGPMRHQVVGLEAVLADGRVLSRMSGVVKDNAGYDLPALLCGSEGTLAVVTRARLRLVPRPPERALALFAVGGSEEALALFRGLDRRLPSLEAAELFFADGLALVCAHRRLSPPFPGEHPAYLLIECADVRSPVEEIAEAVDALAGEPRDVAVADDTARREALWTYRESHTEAINAEGVPHKLDVSVPIAALPEFEQRVREAVERAAPGARTFLFGHVGDGNLHVNVLGPGPEDEAVDEAVLQLVAELGGSVSAEHGIGRLKARWLGLTRSEAEIDAMRAIKRALDPDDILNPGVLLST